MKADEDVCNRTRINLRKVIYLSTSLKKDDIWLHRQCQIGGSVIRGRPSELHFLNFKDIC